MCKVDDPIKGCLKSLIAEVTLTCIGCNFEFNLDVPLKKPMHCSHVRLKRFKCGVCENENSFNENKRTHKAKIHQTIPIEYDVTMTNVKLNSELCGSDLAHLYRIHYQNESSLGSWWFSSSSSPSPWSTISPQQSQPEIWWLRHKNLQTSDNNSLMYIAVIYI